ncbi:MAG: beta galactosidase jelly roll domain-containing protein, partial [Treponema sp.]|nr:beta galactosidase jelly roll domain-containing protein [Treponema sp.]
MDIRYLENWKFSLGAHTDPWAPDFDDGSWEDVVVPHDWAVAFPFSRDHSSGTGYLPGGTGWYRTVFSAAPGEDRRVFVKFDGVYKNSQVWCNGYYLGRRPSGYTGFRYDISHCVRPGNTNVIAVKVSHEDIADSRWYTGSGIYGRVSLQSHGPVYVEPESLRVENETPENGAALVRIRGNVVHGGREAAVVLARAILSGGGERLCAETTLSHVEGETPFCLELPLAAPRLWSAENPNLYRLNLELHAGGVPVYAAPPLNIGIRDFHFDPDRGFFINGKNEKIKGVCIHHDAGCLGAAVWHDVWRRRIGKLKDMGCNAIRMSHN